MGFQHDIAGGNGELIIAQLQSPDFSISDETGWAVMKNGDAYFFNVTAAGDVTATSVIIEGATGQILVYSGTPSSGNLIGAWSGVAGTDSDGNPYIAGLQIGANGQNQILANPNVNQQFNVTTTIAGIFEAMFQYTTTDSNEMMPSMMGSVLLGTGTATKMSSAFHSPFGTEGAVMLLEAQNDAGTDTPVITFGTLSMPGGGTTMVFTPIMTLTPFALIMYSSGGTTTVVTETSGSGTIPIPVGVSAVKGETWGAGGGGGGTDSTDSGWPGGAGGGAEYACEPALAVTGGGTVSYSVGAAGSAGAAGANGGNGGNSTLAGTSVTVTAHGGTGGGHGTASGSGSPGGGGTGGTGSTNTTHFSGGAGGNGAGSVSSPSSGGGGGGSSGGPSSAGNAGHAGNSTTGYGGSGGAAVSGGGPGGTGGNGNSSTPHAGQAPVSGGGPGGGGGGGATYTAIEPGGAGSSGQVRVTYTNGTPAVGFSMNFGSSFTDQFGNTIPAGAVLNGITMTADTWHTITLDSSWSTVSGYAAPSYRLLPDGCLQLTGIAHIASAITGATSLNSSNPLPAAYRPITQKLFRANDATTGRAAVQILTTGVIQAVGPSSGSTVNYCEIDAVLPLNK